MSEQPEKKLDFSLPEGPAGRPPRRGVTAFLVAVVLVLVGANLYLTLRKPAAPPAPAAPPGGLPAGAVKQLALKLEKQGVHEPAAGAWKEYLAGAKIDDEEAAAVWYRIGKLHQDAGAHARALEAFYRSETLAPDSEYAPEIGRRVQESLEALGKFAALRHELAERVGLDDKAAEQSGEVVAEIGTRRITRAELDRQIEAGIENQLAMFAAQLPPDRLKQQKEAMLKQISGDRQRLEFLNSYIVEEILYRKARESKLVEDPGVRARLRDAERSLLARQMMENELRGKILITDDDIALYHEANKQEFVEPARAALSHIVVPDEETAMKVVERVRAGEQFAELAGELSTDEATRDEGGALAAPATRGQPVPGLPVPPDALDPLFEAEPGGLLDTPVKSEAGYHVLQLRELTKERQRPLEEVRSQIHRELFSRKERELQARLLDELREQYDVVIHKDAFQSPPDAE